MTVACRTGLKYGGDPLCLARTLAPFHRWHAALTAFMVSLFWRYLPGFQTLGPGWPLTLHCSTQVPNYGLCYWHALHGEWRAFP